MNTKTLQKLGGFCSISLGLIYIIAFIVYGGILAYPKADATDIERVNFLSENYVMLSTTNLISYVLFGILLAVLVVSIHQKIKDNLPNFSILASVFGVIWVGLVIASGMIANIGLNSVIKIGIEEPQKAISIWTSTGIVSEGLGGGNEIVGAIWVLLLSIAALKYSFFSKPLNFLGLLVALAGILTILPFVVFKEIFGISQIVWFVWIGIAMIRKPHKSFAHKESS
ncbi:hypothetical protein EJ994_05560 [Maribacter sp. MJ134]|uniref:DUF4386 domain-containing protein n=2 Tax=Flavobacteriaceae TaxID=49546 RepID=A0A0P7AP18_9FLAO|nr:MULTISPECIES: hypothetical protein [Flavobacteriaceae]AZQ58300.1 hypothetical protein EJ994_05560 [Maribacter sp. MJ134]KPM33807.1 Hypothetical protein I595_714 [Croceitalea dokdonensis DOKDO 023]